MTEEATIIGRHPAMWLTVNEYGDHIMRCGDREYVHWRARDPSPNEVEAAKVRGFVTEVAWQESYGLDMPLVELEAKLAEIRAGIPRGCRRSLRAEMNTETEYGDTTAYFTVTYKRPETDEEWASRREMVEKLHARAVREQEEADRAEFERLQAKFRDEH